MISDSRTRLLDAAIDIIRTKGYPATRVDDVCAAANMTKGGFFHHFRSKEDLALAAVERWNDTTGTLFEQAPYHAHPDPADRVLAYVDFRRAIIQGEPEQFTCLVGTMVQDVFVTHPELRAACAESITGHAATLEADIEAAVVASGADVDWTARSLALHTQAVLQGAFILAKATGDPQTATASIDHLRRYLAALFDRASKVPGAVSD